MPPATASASRTRMSTAPSPSESFIRDSVCSLRGRDTPLGRAIQVERLAETLVRLFKQPERIVPCRGAVLDQVVRVALGEERQMLEHLDRVRRSNTGLAGSNRLLVCLD